MKKMLGFMLMFSMMMLIVSCGSSVATVANDLKETESVKETVHDTIFRIEKDSASYKALLECVNGKAVIVSVVDTEAGKNLKVPKVKIVGNKLIVDCEARAQELFARYKDTYKSTVNKETKVIRVNELTFWQEFQLWTGRILFPLVCIYIGLLVLQKKWLKM